MEDVPEIRFARSNDASIAYQVFGSGSATIAAVPPMAQNIELSWEWPALRSMFERFGSFARYLHFDKRGTGMSDRGLDIPGIDERVDELRAVMDDAGIDRAYLFGASEGGPMALLYAATYPDRVDGVILEATGASLMSDEERARSAAADVASEREAMFTMFADRWGTPDSMTVDIFAPSLADDEGYQRWHQKYERQCANRDAIVTLLRMNGTMDVRDVLDRIEVPVLILHRTDDRVMPIERGRETAELLRGHGVDVRMVEMPGADHFTFAADLDRILDEIERFTTGTVSPRTPRSTTSVAVAAMGRFDVTVDGTPVPTSEWGSKRARTLLKRLIVARGRPVTRDELIELLWPGEFDPQRLGARLSVQLSAVRRVLGGGVIADRSSIRLDLGAIDLDVETWFALDSDEDIVDRYVGELLPEDRYDDYTVPLREEMRTRFLTAALNVIAASRDDPARCADLARQVLLVDRCHEPAHHVLIQALEATGSRGAAAAAYGDYVNAMREIGAEPVSRRSLG